MSKLLVSANNMEHLYKLLEKDIDGVILYIDKLSVNSSFYVDVDIIEKVDFKEKEIFICLNKIMHNDDLEFLHQVLSYLRDKDVKIFYYDMGVYNMCKRYDMVSKLVIYQDHLNASGLSNKFYYDLGIRGSYITSDITKEELFQIKMSTDMDVYFTVYGYLPIFYSRRYLVSNYLEYIGNEKGTKYEIVSDMGDSYPICEERYGATIYTKEIVNLINYLDELDEIDYIVMHSNMIDDIEFNMMVDRFINRDKMEDCYLGFFNTKTIYKVK